MAALSPDDDRKDITPIRIDFPELGIEIRMTGPKQDTRVSMHTTTPRRAGSIVLEEVTECDGPIGNCLTSFVKSPWSRLLHPRYVTQLFFVICLMVQMMM